MTRIERLRDGLKDLAEAEASEIDDRVSKVLGYITDDLCYPPKRPLLGVILDLVEKQHEALARIDTIHPGGLSGVLVATGTDGSALGAEFAAAHEIARQAYDQFNQEEG